MSGDFEPGDFEELGTERSEAEVASILRCGYEHAGFADSPEGRIMESLFAWMDDGELIEADEFPGGPWEWMSQMPVDDMAADGSWVKVSSPTEGSSRAWTFHRPDPAQPDGAGNPHWTARFFAEARS